MMSKHLTAHRKSKSCPVIHVGKYWKTWIMAWYSGTVMATPQKLCFFFLVGTICILWVAKKTAVRIMLWILLLLVLWLRLCLIFNSVLKELLRNSVLKELMSHLYLHLHKLHHATHVSQHWECKKQDCTTVWENALRGQEQVRMQTFILNKCEVATELQALHKT